MSSHSYHVATIRRCTAVVATILLSACAFHGVERQAPQVAPASEPSQVVREGYVVDTPEFALVTSSSFAKTTALESLRGTVATFEWLFGNAAPHIGVVVADGRTMSPPAAARMMPEDLTTIMVMTREPDPAERARSAAELANALRTMAADAWMHDYANQWAAATDVEGAHEGVEPDARASRAEALPHWLRVGALRMIAEGKQKGGLTSPRATLPLRDLFSFELAPAGISAVSRMLHDSERLTAVSADDSPDDANARAFIVQSASVLRFIRDTQGDTATSDLFGASMTGMPVEEILAQLPHPTSIANLEANWLTWLTARRRNATAEVTP